MMRKIVPLTLLLLAVGCVQTQETQSYGYRHMECTGITDYLVAGNGEIIPVQFSSLSDKKALGALRALKWNVLFPNANGKQITVSGVLNPKALHTPKSARHPQSESYREFELKSWFIKVPFERQFWKDGVEGPGGILLSEQKMTLDENDFSVKIDDDLSQFSKAPNMKKE